MNAGTKAAVDQTPLPFCPRSLGAARFGAFCEKFVKVPKGTGARTPLRLRDWQQDLVGSVLDADPQPRFGNRSRWRWRCAPPLGPSRGLQCVLVGGLYTVWSHVRHVHVVCPPPWPRQA